MTCLPTIDPWTFTKAMLQTLFIVHFISHFIVYIKSSRTCNVCVQQLAGTTEARHTLVIVYRDRYTINKNSILYKYKHFLAIISALQSTHASIFVQRSEAYLRGPS